MLVGDLHSAVVGGHCTGRNRTRRRVMESSLLEMPRNHRAGTDVSDRLKAMSSRVRAQSVLSDESWRHTQDPTTGELSCQPAMFSRRDNPKKASCRFAGRLSLT